MLKSSFSKNLCYGTLYWPWMSINVNVFLEFNSWFSNFYRSVMIQLVWEWDGGDFLSDFSGSHKMCNKTIQNYVNFLIQYWPKVTHGPAHFLRARSARHLQYMNGRHTRDNASEVRIPHVWHACVKCCRSSIPRTSHADVVHMMRASYARHSSSKCDVKRAGSTHHTRCTWLEKCAS
jgi:hypothetical protein